MTTPVFRPASVSARHPLPPRLSMDDYVLCIEASRAHCDPRKAARQKAIEEDIKKPFRIGSADMGH